MPSRAGAAAVAGAEPRRSVAPRAASSRRASTSGRGPLICWDCGQPGHWTGDNDCPTPGARKFAPKPKAKGRGGRGRQDRSVQITELGDDGEAELHPDGPVTPPLEPESLVSERVVPDLPSVNNTDSGKLVADEGLGVVDTACLFCVAGQSWYDNYKGLLTKMGLSDQILEESENELYRFGNGGTLPSKLRVTAPIVLCGRAGRIAFSAVNSPALGLLIGRDFIQPSKIDISLWKGIIRIGNQTQALVTSSAGHPAIKLHPEDW